MDSRPLLSHFPGLGYKQSVYDYIMKKKSHKNETKKLTIFTRMFKNRTLINKNQFSRVQLLVFIGFFGAVGGYVLLKSFASAPIKPPMQGLVLRSPVTPPAGYEGAISGMVVNINWSDLQPNSTNDPIPANNAVDKANNWNNWAILAGGLRYSLPAPSLSIGR
jgi:hypothetical protein